MQTTTVVYSNTTAHRTTSRGWPAAWGEWNQLGRGFKWQVNSNCPSFTPSRFLKYYIIIVFFLFSELWRSCKHVQLLERWSYLWPEMLTLRNSSRSCPHPFTTPPYVRNEKHKHHMLDHKTKVSVYASTDFRYYNNYFASNSGWPSLIIMCTNELWKNYQTSGLNKK